MDGKKKRNKKKKGNQGKNTGDVTSSAGEAAPRSHNHDSARKDHHGGADPDDAMSSAGEGIPQYQNHELTPQANQDGANADETISSVGEVIPCYESHEPTMTQENLKVSNTVHAEQGSIGMSDSSVELDKDRLYEVKLDKLHETRKELEGEKNLWLQKMSMVESELEKLHNKVGHHAKNEVLLEEKLNNLQNVYDVLVKKEEVLDNRVRCIEDVNGVLTHQKTSLKERLSGLEETNKALQEQVKVLDEASKNTVEENLRLAINVDELESRLQALEAKIVLTEASMTKEGNELIAEGGLNSYVTITSEGNYSHANNSPSSAYASNHPDEALVCLPEETNSNSADQSLIDANAHQGFDEPRMSEEIVPVTMDDIQIHEDHPQPPGSDDETAEVPFTDAPIVGAPFRLISFVARYVSGADLVN